MRINTNNSQRGAALIVALLLLFIVTLIGISGMNNSIFDLRMAGNTQSYYDSLQQAESGIAAAMSQRNTNFKGLDKNNIFDTGGSNVLKDVINPVVNIKFLHEAESIGHTEDASSKGALNYEFYTVDSNHTDSITGANTHIYQGVVREILD